MIYALLQLPFLTILLGDYFLIKAGKKDIQWYWQCAIGAAFVLILTDHRDEILPATAVAIMPFCFFDLALNGLRRKPWHYQGENQKPWDRAIKWLTGRGGLSHELVLIGRVICFGLLIWYVV